MNKFHRRQIMWIDDNDDYHVSGMFVGSVACAVCGDVPWKGHTGAGTNALTSHHLMIFGDIHYIVPYWHYPCKELLELNPLAYE